MTSNVAQIALQKNQEQVTTLWVSNYIAARHLPGVFDIREFTDLQEINGGNHVILAEPNTKVSVIKAIAWRIIKSGGTCRVHRLNNYLQNLICDSFTAKDLAIHIGEFALWFDEWVERDDETPLSVREAAEVAKGAIALLDPPQCAVELETLRQRCGAGAWQWSKTVGELEKQFKQEVTRRQIGNQQASEFDLLKLELGAIAAESDPIAQTYMLSQLSQHQGVKVTELREMLKATVQANKVAESEIFEVDQMLNLETTGIDWLIPGMLPRGETIILAGSPKAGKTLLAIDAAFALATGEDNFLGETITNRQKVLLISCDESSQSTRNKLLNRGFRSSDRGSIRIMTKWTINQLSTLESQLEDFRPDIVIIDSLKRITHGSLISENSAEFADNIYTLKELIGRYGASGILIHHTNKNPEAMGVYRIRGNGAIAGAVWGTWQLDHIPVPDPNNSKKLIIDPKDPRRTLHVYSRDSEGQSLMIEFNPENYGWNLKDKPEETNEQMTTRQRIMKVLGLNIQGLSGREIIECLNMTPEEGRGVYTELNRMVAKRIINCKPAMTDKRVNLYSLVESSNLNIPPLPTNSIEVVEYKAESIDNTKVSNTQQDTQQHNEVTQQPLDNQQVLNNKNLVIESDIEILNNSDKNKGGEVNNSQLAIRSSQLNTTANCELRIDNCDEAIAHMELLIDALKCADEAGEILVLLLNPWTVEQKAAVRKLIKKLDAYM